MYAHSYVYKYICSRGKCFYAMLFLSSLEMCNPPNEPAQPQQQYKMVTRQFQKIKRIDNEQAEAHVKYNTRKTQEIYVSIRWNVPQNDE